MPLGWIPDVIAYKAFDFADTAPGYAVALGLLAVAAAVVYAARQLRR